MATITRVNVTLTNDEADLIARLLSQMSHNDFEHANRTKSAAVRAFARARGEQAAKLEAELVRRMYGVTEESR